MTWLKPIMKPEIELVSGMPNIYAFDYDSKPTQPRHERDMTDKEIEEQRIKILESAKLAEWLESRLENRECHRNTEPTSTFTREEIGIIGYYVGMGDKDGLYRYINELIGKDVESIVRKLEE